MAALGPLHSTPARQPFGMLDNSKLRSLQSTKNKQNALSSQSLSLKRRAISPELSDSENVDPNLFDNLKRKRASHDDDVTTSKTARYSLNVLPTKPRLESSQNTPQIVKPTSTPLSAPAAAGRSPIRSRPQLNLLKPRKRFLPPPSFARASPSLSIAAALQGTLANKKPKRKAPTTTIEDSKPKTWFFDIYEEPESVQDDRMNEWTLSQSATILDISNDENKAKLRDDRGKENIDPDERSKKTATMEEDRKPLGDLNPTDYYAEGLDATSVILVHDNDGETEAVAETEVECSAHGVFESSTHQSVGDKGFNFEAPVSIGDISTIVATNTVVETETLGIASEHAGIDIAADYSEDIEIWESESAKDEEEKVGGMEDGIFALQEL